MIYHKYKGFYKKFSKKQFRKFKQIEIEFGLEWDDYLYYDDFYYEYEEDHSCLYYRHFDELICVPYLNSKSKSYSFYDFEGNFLFNSYEV